MRWLTGRGSRLIRSKEEAELLSKRCRMMTRSNHLFQINSVAVVAAVVHDAAKSVGIHLQRTLKEKYKDYVKYKSQDL